MRALLKKELTELLVPFGIAFFVIAISWLLSVRFWDALLPLASEMLMVVGATSAITGVGIGYLQFSSERWRGKLAYLNHRGTGVEGPFLAKLVAGLCVTALVGFGPPLLYAASARLTSPNAPIIHWSLLASYASAATAGASLYGLGTLAASLRRRTIAGVLLIPFGGFGLWVISEMFGTPWMGRSPEWIFPVLQLAAAGVLLALVRRLSRSSVDRDLPLPRGVHLAVVALALPLVLFPCEIGATGISSFLLETAREEYPTILRDRKTEEIFPVVRRPQGHFRLGPDGRLGAPVHPDALSGSDSAFDTVFTGRWYSGSSDAGPPIDRAGEVEPLFAGRELLPISIRHHSLASDSVLHRNVQTYLDRRRGVVLAIRYIVDLEPDGVPFWIELDKPDGTKFSPATLVLHGEAGAVDRLARTASSEPAEPLPPGVKVKTPYGGGWLGIGVLVRSCLLDPSDGSFWRLDVDVRDSKTPLIRVELPANDRFVRFQALYRRSDLVFGRYRSVGGDRVVVGERGRYVWNGRELVTFGGSDAKATLDEAEDVVRYHVVVEDPDPLRWTVRVEDVKQNREVFTYDFAPRTESSSFAAAVAQASVLLRSPFTNTLVFLGILHPRSRELAVRSEFLSEGRRPWLWAADLVVALGCAGIGARILRRRLTSPVRIALGCSFVLLFGPAALLVVWFLEPKGRSRELEVVRVPPEPALVIQSA